MSPRPSSAGARAGARGVSPLPPPVVRFEEPETPDGRTVIEVRANDEPGLVYTIAATLAELGMDISFAKIATEKNQALDIFYVSNAEGSALSSREVATVQRALMEALNGDS